MKLSLRPMLNLIQEKEVIITFDDLTTSKQNEISGILEHRIPIPQPKAGPPYRSPVGRPLPLPGEGKTNNNSLTEHDRLVAGKIKEIKVVLKIS